MICDLAETYGVLDYKALPVQLLATLCAGLRDDSRINLKLSGLEQLPPAKAMLASAADYLNLLHWGLTEGAKNGTRRPALFTDHIGGEQRSCRHGYASGAEFEAARAALIKEANG